MAHLYYSKRKRYYWLWLEHTSVLISTTSNFLKKKTKKEKEEEREGEEKKKKTGTILGCPLHIFPCKEVMIERAFHLDFLLVWFLSQATSSWWAFVYRLCLGNRWIKCCSVAQFLLQLENCLILWVYACVIIQMYTDKFLNVN